MRQADCEARLGREQSRPHVVPLVLPCLRLSLEAIAIYEEAHPDALAA
jgi:hypothetical protein